MATAHEEVAAKAANLPVTAQQMRSGFDAAGVEARQAGLAAFQAAVDEFVAAVDAAEAAAVGAPQDTATTATPTTAAQG